MTQIGGKLWAALCLLALLSSSFTAASEASNDLLREADSLYLAEDYGRAATLFKQLARGQPAGEQRRYEFLAAKAYYRSGEYRPAAELFGALLSKESPSFIRAASRFYLGNIEFSNGNYMEAARQFAGAYQADRNAERREIYLRSLQPLLADRIESEVSEKLLAAISDSLLKINLFCSLAERYFVERRYQTLIDQIDRHLAGPQTPPCEDRLAWLQQQSLLRLGDTARIGILVPQSGPLAGYGSSIIEGAQLAVEEFEQRSAQKVSISIMDTGGDAITAAAVAARLTDEAISAVLGPLTSEAAASVISRMSCSGVPVISPTASESGLSRIDGNFFQLTPPVGALAAHLGEFVVRELKLDSLVVIYPNDPHGQEANRAFSDTVEALGAKVFFQRSFQPNDADFRDILLELKELILPDTFDTTVYLDDEGDTLETEEIQVDIKAIYIPASEAQLSLMIPQIHFYKINTTFLGIESWDSERIVGMSELETRDVFFIDDLLALPDDREYNYFHNRYQQRYGHPPDLVAARAFDAAVILCSAFEAVGTAPEAVSSYLANGGEISGVSGKIKFNSRHENQSASIYRLSNGVITRERQ